MENTTAAAKTAAKSALRTCRCGCEAPLGGKAAYRPGHDARHVSNLKARLDITSASSDRSPEAKDRVQEEVYVIFAELKSVALRQKLGRAVDNDKEGLYNSFGDAGVFVPYSDNPSLGSGHDNDQAAFEARYPADAPKAKKAPKAKVEAPAITEADGEDAALYLTIEDETPAVPEPMWTETTQDEAPLEVKVGRWTYPARRRSNGKLERNVNRLGEGEWVPAEESQLVK